MTTPIPIAVIAGDGVSVGVHGAVPTLGFPTIITETPGGAITTTLGMAAVIHTSSTIITGMDTIAADTIILTVGGTATTTARRAGAIITPTILSATTPITMVHERWVLALRATGQAGVLMLTIR